MPSDRRSAQQRGYDARWQKERASFLATHPWCAMQGEGCTRIATVVDHIQPHRGDRLLFWDMSNWQPLCAHCHSKHKQALENKGPLRDSRGRLIF